MTRTGSLVFLLLVALSGGCENTHNITNPYYYPSAPHVGLEPMPGDLAGHSERIVTVDATRDAGAPGDAAPLPGCTSSLTQQGTVCVLCTGGDGKPVFSCTSTPTTSAGCLSLEVTGYSCTVCYDAKGVTTSKSCAPKNGCTSVIENDKVCLVCSVGGKEVSRKCVSTTLTCKSITSANEVCVECRDAAGQLVEKQCLPVTQTCSSQSVGGKLCLVCKDAAGQVVKTICEGSDAG